MAASKAVGATKAFQLFKYTLPKLPYDYKALEPIISRETMELHHTKHHQAYIKNLNIVQEQLAEANSKQNISKAISLTSALRFNGGGHINHSIFWQNLTPTKTKPSEKLMRAIEQDFSSFDGFKKEMTDLTVDILGSGWGWLGFNKQTKQLKIITTRNQDPLEPTTGIEALFGIDVWEHAYYLQYKNQRASYVEAIWDIANWDDISERFANATKDI